MFEFGSKPKAVEELAVEIGALIARLDGQVRDALAHFGMPDRWVQMQNLLCFECASVYEIIYCTAGDFTENEKAYLKQLHLRVLSDMFHTYYGLIHPPYLSKDPQETLRVSWQHFSKTFERIKDDHVALAMDMAGSRKGSREFYFGKLFANGSKHFCGEPMGKLFMKPEQDKQTTCSCSTDEFAKPYRAALRAFPKTESSSARRPEGGW